MDAPRLPSIEEMLSTLQKNLGLKDYSETISFSLFVAKKVASQIFTSDAFTSYPVYLGPRGIVLRRGIRHPFHFQKLRPSNSGAFVCAKKQPKIYLLLISTIYDCILRGRHDRAIGCF